MRIWGCFKFNNRSWSDIQWNIEGNNAVDVSQDIDKLGASESWSLTTIWVRPWALSDPAAEWLHKDTAVSRGTPLQSTEVLTRLTDHGGRNLCANFVSFKLRHEPPRARGCTLLCGVKIYEDSKFGSSPHSNLLMLTYSLALSHSDPFLSCPFLYWMICMGTVLRKVSSLADSMIAARGTILLGNRGFHLLLCWST